MVLLKPAILFPLVDTLFAFSFYRLLQLFIKKYKISIPVPKTLTLGGREINVAKLIERIQDSKIYALTKDSKVIVLVCFTTNSILYATTRRSLSKTMLLFVYSSAMREYFERSQNYKEVFDLTGPLNFCKHKLKFISDFTLSPFFPKSEWKSYVSEHFSLSSEELLDRVRRHVVTVDYVSRNPHLSLSQQKLVLGIYQEALQTIDCFTTSLTIAPQKLSILLDVSPTFTFSSEDLALAMKKCLLELNFLLEKSVLKNRQLPLLIKDVVK